MGKNKKTHIRFKISTRPIALMSGFACRTSGNFKT